jgi:nucleotide-binding universal stress UspA family protein
MKNIRHILFPVDFSERCCQTAPFVASMARRYSAKVTLLSVVPPFCYAMSDASAAVMVNMDELLEDLRTRLDGPLFQEFAGLDVDRIAALGEPARGITDFAQAHTVDLIMMPTHGYGPFRRLLLGSVTAKVLHDATCPVWTSAHLDQAPSHADAASGEILCAVDIAPDSVPLMRWANEFGKDAEATLRLVHVVPGMEGVPSGQMDLERSGELRKEAHEALDKLEASAEVSAPICVTGGNISESICEEARRHDADLLVIGRGGLHEMSGRLRSHVYGIVRQSPCPVVSV